jgi:hypothetical protein
MSVSCYKIGQAKNPTLRLAFALLTFQSSGENEPALREWKAKPKTDQTFVKVRVFMQKEFEKHNKQNKTTAKSVGHGIANSITDKEVKQILSAYLCDNKIAKKTGNNH